MTFIPNEQDAGVDGEQSELDSVDLSILLDGFRLRGVKSGCAVTAASNLDVSVAAGTVYFDGAEVSIAGGTLSLAAAGSQLRFDLVVADSGGTLSIIDGTAAFDATYGPSFPDYGSDEVVLAVVTVPANATSLAAGNIVDKRVTLSMADHGLLSGLSDDDHTQYHNDSRALTWLGTRSTTDLPEGTNLYFTNERAQDAVGGILTNSSSVTFTYDDALNTITATVVASGVDHGSLSGLGDDDHPQYTTAAEAVVIASAAVAAHEGLPDPHTGYRLESADHTHQSTGLQAGQLDHGLALTGLTDDDHTQYVLRSILTTNGDIFVRLAGAVDRLGVGANDTYLGVTGGLPAWRAQSTLDHGSLGGLADDDHTQYLLLAGRAGGQIAHGGTGVGDDLLLRTTSDATKGRFAVDSSFEVIEASGEINVLDASLNNTGDFGFRATTADIPTLLFDSDDRISFDRVNEEMLFFVNAVEKLTLLTSHQIVFGNGFLTTQDEFYMGRLSATTPRINFDNLDFMYYDRGNNTYNWAIGNTILVELAATSWASGVPIYGSAQIQAGTFLVVGDILPPVDSGDGVAYIQDRLYIGNADLTDDELFYLDAANATTPRITFDSTDFIQYVRGSNLFEVAIGGTVEARVQASGLGVLGWGRVGSLTAPSNTTAGDFTAERVAIGANAAFSSSSGLLSKFGGTLTTTAAGAAIAFMMAPTYAPASASSTEFRSLTFSGTVDAGGNAMGTVTGIWVENPLADASGGFTGSLRGIVTQAAILRSSATANTGAIPQAIALFAQVASRPSGTFLFNIDEGFGIIVNGIGNGIAGDDFGDEWGIYIDNIGGTRTTNSVALEIEQQSGSATTNFGFKNNSNSLQTGYARFGGVTAPTDTGSGVVYVDDRLYIGNADLTTDELFYLDGASTVLPRITFDSTDFLQYNRTSNFFDFTIGGSGVAELLAGGFEHVGYGRFGSLTAPTNTTAGDLTFIRQFLGVQETAVTDRTLNARADIGGTVNATVYSFAANYPSGAASAVTIKGIQAGLNAGHTSGTLTELVAIEGSVSSNAAGNTTLESAVAGQVNHTGAGTTASLAAFRVRSPFYTAGTVTLSAGLVVANMGVASRVTNAIGIDIAAQSDAATLNIGIRNSDGRYLTAAVSQPAAAPAGTLFVYARDHTFATALWTRGDDSFETSTVVRARTFCPLPVIPFTSAPVTATLAANDDNGFVGLVIVPAPIRIASVQYNAVGGGAANTVIRVVLYSEDGQNQLFNATDAVGAGTGVRTVDVTDVTIPAGIYYLMIGHSTFDTSGKQISCYDTDNTFNAHATEPDVCGTIVWTNGVAPATFTPTSAITATADRTPYMRFIGVALGS